ncbi:hypothetical protein BH11BAC2_BH11BAC2_16550 [soil metagenome]
MRIIKNRIFCTITFTFIVLSIKVNAQLNLIPNASFEDTVSCPYDGIGAGSGGFCALWYACINSPDYWTECSDMNIIPNTGPSYQYAHSGTKMFGIATYTTPIAVASNFREIFGIDLISSTTSGQKYFFSMFICQAYSKTPWFALLATNKMGMRLTNSQCSNFNLPQINNITDYCDSFFHTDTSNWVKISGSFIANGNFSKIQIGNFYDDAHTDTMNLDHDSLIYQNAGAYYFIDDVCLSTDSLYAATWTGIDEHHQLTWTINIYPNPVNDFLNVKFGNSGISNHECILTDLTGKTIYRRTCKEESEIQINLSTYPPGIYFLNIFDGENFVTRKVVHL